MFACIPKMHAKSKKCMQKFESASKNARKYSRMRAKCLHRLQKCAQKLKNARKI